jgi:DICT domain-containing protein
MDCRKSERFFYHNGMWDFRSFGQFDTQKLISIQLLFCPETEFSSEVNLQNSMTSKPFSGQSCMSNGWKYEIVSQVFSVQLRDRIWSEQSCFRFFVTAVRLIPDSIFTFSR